MSTSKPPAPRAVSAFPGRKYPRSTTGRPMRHEGGWVPVYPGFKVPRGLGLPGTVRHVVVQHVLGSRDESLPLERQKEIIRERLTCYRECLERRYRVTVEPGENGEWDALLVWAPER